MYMAFSIVKRNNPQKRRQKNKAKPLGFAPRFPFDQNTLQTIATAITAATQMIAVVATVTILISSPFSFN